MRIVWGREHLKKHTAPSRGCENFIRDNATGGIVQTPGVGTVHDELLLLDMGSAWLSRYVLHPTGTAIPFDEECPYIDEFFTYFAVCDVYIREELALGPFPFRTNRVTGKRVIWPTLPGVYSGVVLWKEQVTDCVRAGCLVKVREGFGWRNYTSDNFYWSNESYGKRHRAYDEFATGLCKASNTAAVGSHFQPRESFFLSNEGSFEEGDVPLELEGEVIDGIWRRREEDWNKAYMVHWYAYTIAMCNSHVYQFALPFAKEGRLVQIDYDSVLILEKDERHQYVRREYARHFDLPPGTWLWMLLHNVHDIKDRSFKSDELSKTPGEPSVA